MAVTRRKRRANSKKKRFSRYRGKGIYHRPPSFLPIPPPRAPSLPIPPPRAPSPPMPIPYIPIPPPPKPLFIEPSPTHFIIRSPSPHQQSQKKPKAKKPKSEPSSALELAPALEPSTLAPAPALAPTQQRRSLRQLIINSDKNKKIKRK